MDIDLAPTFVSHGSPMIALQPGPAGAFLRRLGPLVAPEGGRPRAVLAISAHTAARVPVLLAASRHEAIHDFGNFDPRLFDMRYDAPGAPELAVQVAALLGACGLNPQRLDQGGLDHGIWTVLRYVFPLADVPVLPLAFSPHASPEQQWALGAALAPLRAQGVWILATGSLTHNLRRALGGGLHAPMQQPEIPECAAFREWWRARSAAADWPALFDYRARAPHAVDMHPTDEHLLPWFVAAGAGGPDHPAARLHASVQLGCLGMDAYAFGPGATGLAERVASQAALPEPVTA